MDKTFPAKAKVCASVSVSVGKVKEPPPLESVTTFPFWVNVCNSLFGLESPSAGNVTEFPFEMDKTLPAKAKVCASVSVGIGIVTGVLATPLTIVVN